MVYSFGSLETFFRILKIDIREKKKKTHNKSHSGGWEPKPKLHMQVQHLIVPPADIRNKRKFAIIIIIILNILKGCNSGGRSLRACVDLLNAVSLFQKFLGLIYTC